jgi:hypothetical protein
MTRYTLPLLAMVACGPRWTRHVTVDGTEGIADWRPEGRGPGGGPITHRLMLARSEDGRVWTRTGQIVAERADVPDMVVLPDGRLAVYYIAAQLGTRGNTIAVGMSSDGGESWTHRPVELSRPEGLSDPVDPDAVVHRSGEVWLYLTADPHDGAGPRTWRATSADGVAFEWGEVVAQASNWMLDPTVVQLGRRWLLLAGGRTPTPQSNWIGGSTNGKRFQLTGDIAIGRDGVPERVANVVERPEGGWRMYTFTASRPSSILSFTSDNGRLWSAEDGQRLAPDAQVETEHGGVKDPAVAQLPDGTWVMIYVTGNGETQPEDFRPPPRNSRPQQRRGPPPYRPPGPSK